MYKSKFKSQSEVDRKDFGIFCPNEVCESGFCSCAVDATSRQRCNQLRMADNSNSFVTLNWILSQELTEKFLNLLSA